MNWTGGALSRSRSRNAVLTAIQRRHFAKAKIKLLHGQRQPSHADFPVFNDTQGQAVYTDPHRQVQNSQITLEEYENLLPKVRRLEPSKSHRRGGKRHARPSPSTDVESKRHELLSRRDWIGLEQTRPVHMQFADPTDRDLIGKRRRLSKMNNSPPNIQPRYHRPLTKTFEELNMLRAASCKSHSSDEISVRIGSSEHVLGKKGSEKPTALATQQSAVSDEMLLGSDEPYIPHQTMELQYTNGKQIKEDETANMLFDYESEERSSSHSSPFSPKMPLQKISGSVSSRQLNTQKRFDLRIVRSGCRPSGAYTISSGSLSESSADYVQNAGCYEVSKHIREQSAEDPPPPSSYPTSVEGAVQSWLSDDFPAELLRTSSPCKQEHAAVSLDHSTVRGSAEFTNSSKHDTSSKVLNNTPMVKETADSNNSLSCIWRREPPDERNRISSTPLKISPYCQPPESSQSRHPTITSTRASLPQLSSPCKPSHTSIQPQLSHEEEERSWRAFIFGSDPDELNWTTNQTQPQRKCQKSPSVKSSDSLTSRVPSPKGILQSSTRTGNRSLSVHPSSSPLVDESTNQSSSSSKPDPQEDPETETAHLLSQIANASLSSLSPSSAAHSAPSPPRIAPIQETIESTTAQRLSSSSPQRAQRVTQTRTARKVIFRPPKKFHGGESAIVVLRIGVGNGKGREDDDDDDDDERDGDGVEEEIED
ncbi:MAG: hypothetical protein Q9190_001939 [Brigantiaea leucoxantha]